jgi:16S rRNA (cytosine1402-N4)-methyltransferase
VNDELGELARALHAAEAVLKPGGRLAVVTFHSLEDRIVKQFFAARSGRGGGSRHLPLAASAATFAIEGRWPVTPEVGEVAFNPRARSAKLRAGVRTDAPAEPADRAIMALAALPERRGRAKTGGRR